MSINSDPLNKTGEAFPVHEKVKVLRGLTLFKNQKWWEAVLLVEVQFGERAYKKISWYRWNWGTVTPRQGAPFQKWIRKEHKNINFNKNWQDAFAIINEYVKELT